ENGNSDLYKNTLFANSNGNYVNVQGDKKVAIIRDLNDFIVVDTDKALLICKRENEQTLTEMLNDAKVKFGDGIK
ncbi:MAG: mannose-1-phosphate guanylyltransferase, partial [Bacteroidales bacterium]|nr:mannose-1-phosphate guanylyltransferase [Bacteroidales bacterium]